ncbi:MAG: hypothetical protein ACOC2K_04315, partial [Bacteroidota bacterium]
MLPVKLAKRVVRELDKYLPTPIFYIFMMTPEERILFDSVIKDSTNYLEFGIGGSSIRTLIKSKANIYTIDTSVG